MGIGDWGVGIGDWAQSPIPNPQSPIPNPHLLFKNYINILLKKININKLFKQLIYLIFKNYI